MLNRVFILIDLLLVGELPDHAKKFFSDEDHEEVDLNYSRYKAEE